METHVFIDGGNLYRRLKECGITRTSDFDYWGLIQFVCEGELPSYVGYYVGQVEYQNGDSRSMHLFRMQQRFLTKLKKNVPIIKIIPGKLLKNGNTFHEKGVDVRLALDLYKSSRLDNCCRLVLISSDSDMLPAAALAQELGSCVRYVGFRHAISYSLVKGCWEKCILNKEMLHRFSG